MLSSFITTEEESLVCLADYNSDECMLHYNHLLPSSGLSLYRQTITILVAIYFLDGRPLALLVLQLLPDLL